MVAQESARVGGVGVVRATNHWRVLDWNLTIYININS